MAATRPHFRIAKSDKDGQWYWHLRARNGKNISTGGEGFTTHQACKKSVEVVIKEIVYAVDHMADRSNTTIREFITVYKDTPAKDPKARPAWAGQNH